MAGSVQRQAFERDRRDPSAGGPLAHSADAYTHIMDGSRTKAGGGHSQFLAARQEPHSASLFATSTGRPGAAGCRPEARSDCLYQKEDEKRFAVHPGARAKIIETIFMRSNCQGVG